MTSLIDFSNLELNSISSAPPVVIPTIIKTKQSIKIINSIKTEICIQLYLNKILILITQLNRIGSMIQINPPPPTAALSTISTQSSSSSSSTHPSLFPSLPSPHPAITLSPIFGIAPSIKLSLLYDLYANQIGAIVFDDFRKLREDGDGEGGDSYGGELPVLLGIGLKVVKSEGDDEEDDEGVTEADRECFGEVMNMVKECRVW